MILEQEVEVVETEEADYRPGVGFDVEASRLIQEAVFGA
jgi:hypothetical protein